jgi:hypothetical protein
MKVSIFTILGMIGTLSTELTKAASDGKITVKEAIKIMEAICKQLGIEFDKTGLNIQ